MSWLSRRPPDPPTTVPVPDSVADARLERERQERAELKARVDVLDARVKAIEARNRGHDG